MFDYLKRVIDKDDPASSKNFIALASCLTLCLVLVYLVAFRADSPHIVTIATGLVLLASFHRPDTGT
jgi:hypothetical protein